MDVEKEIGELFSKHYDEIVYHDHTAEVLSNVIECVEKAGFERIGSIYDSCGEQQYLYINGGKKLTIWDSRGLGALYIYTRDTDGEVEKVLSRRCMKCSSEELIEGIMYSHMSEIDEKLIELGVLDYWGDAWDRWGVPPYNWRCRKCGFKWFRLRDLVRKDRSELYWHIMENKI